MATGEPGGSGLWPLPSRFLLVTLLIKDVLTYKLGNTVELPITNLSRDDPRKYQLLPIADSADHHRVVNQGSHTLINLNAGGDRE